MVSFPKPPEEARKKGADRLKNVAATRNDLFIVIRNKWARKNNSKKRKNITNVPFLFLAKNISKIREKVVR